jgi:hypothetical protein
MKAWQAKAMMALLLLLTPMAQAADGWRTKFPEMVLVGSGILEVLFLDIYRLSLYTESGKFEIGKDFILEFDYLTSVSKKTIANASINELAKLDGVSAADIKSWQLKLDRGLVDMEKGDKAAIIFGGSGKITFVAPNQPPLTFDDRRFAESYAAIWLGPQTAFPMLRQRLLGNGT